MRWLAALTLLIGPAGCGLLLDPEPPLTNPSDDDDGGSADGGIGLDDARVRADGSLGRDARMIPVGCNAPPLLRDDFETPELNSLWEPPRTVPGAGFDQSNDRLVLEPPSSTMGGVSYISKYAFDLRESSVSVLVTEALDYPDVVVAFLSLVGPTSSESLAIRLTRRQLIARRVTPGGTDESAIGYVPDMHRWWRIRETAGMVYFEASMDGASGWREIGRIGTPDFAIAVQVEIGVYAAGPSGETGWVAFDELNLQPAAEPDSTFCAASSFSDTFDDDATDPRWKQNASMGCTVDEAGGLVTFTLLDNEAPAICEYVARPGYDLRSDSVTLDVPEITMFDSSVSFFFKVFDRDVSIAEMRFEAGELNIYNGGTEMTVPYGGANFWRIREASGVIHFELSPDGTTWADHPMTSAIDASAVTVVYGVRGLGSRGGDYPISVRAYNP